MDTYLIGALSGFGPRDRYELDNALHAPHTDELFNVAYIAPDWDGKADHYVLVNARNLAAFERQAVAFHKESSRTVVASPRHGSSNCRICGRRWIRSWRPASRSTSTSTA